MSTYVGDGLNPHAIEGIGFESDLVMIKRQSEGAAELGDLVFKLNTLAGDSTWVCDTAAPGTGLILSIDADGFTLDNGNGLNGDFVNKSGVTYHYVCIKVGASDGTQGTYNGDNADGRSISIGAFTPSLILLASSATTAPLIWVDTMAAGESQPFEGGTAITTGIESVSSGAFTVDSTHNVTGRTYHYIALKNIDAFMNVVTYEGNGADNRSISGFGFQPEFAYVLRGATSAAAVRLKDSSGDDSMAVTGGDSIANVIQAFEADGIQVGTNAFVNAGTGELTYHAWGLKSGTGSDAAGGIEMALRGVG